MCHRRFRKVIGCLFTVVLCLLGLPWPAGGRVSAQQLSIRHYDVSKGLANSHVSAMYQDAKGYPWLATWEGLSRFDGYRFTNYGVRDGVGDPIVNAIGQDRKGRIWVGTNGSGIARLADDPQASTSDSSTARQKFISFPIGNSGASNRVNAMIFDSQDNLWCATDGGLYRAAMGKGGQPNFEAILPDKIEMDVAFDDSHGRLWFGMQKVLIEIDQDQITRYGSDDEVGLYDIKHVTEEHEIGVFAALKKPLKVKQLAGQILAGRKTPGRTPGICGGSNRSPAQVRGPIHLTTQLLTWNTLST